VGAQATPLHGQVWKYPGLLDIDVDLFSWPLAIELKESGVKITYENLAQYCLAEVDPLFASNVSPGDFLVTEGNVGYGHDHDYASIALRGLGVAAVVCESSAPYFLRNSLDHGLPVLEIPGIFEAVETGDRMIVDIVAGRLEIPRSLRSFEFTPYPDFLLERLAEGGLYPWLSKQIKPEAGS